MKTLEGKLNAKGLKIAIVCSRFNELITSKLLGGALDCFVRSGGDREDIVVTWVPGSFEIPLAAKKLAEKKSFDAIICLGAVIRGSTGHYDQVAGEVTKGIGSVSLETNIPIIFGVLTTDSIEQAIERAGTKAGNKGFESAMSAIEMANLLKVIE